MSARTVMNISNFQREIVSGEWYACNIRPNLKNRFLLSQQYHPVDSYFEFQF